MADLLVECPRIERVLAALEDAGLSDELVIGVFCPRCSGAMVRNPYGGMDCLGGCELGS